MRVLVTGGSGYIGSRLMAALATRQDVDEIIDVDVRPPARGIPKVSWVERSVTEDLRDLFDKKRRVDLAMHLAWVLDPLRDPGRQRTICIGGTNRFLEGVTAGEVKHVFFMSSAAAYGAHPAHATPVPESEPLKARHHFQYSAEKREAEGLFQAWARGREDVLLQIARPCVVAGPNVSNFIFRAVERPVTFRALGHDPPLQLVHEDDCAAALVAIVTSRRPGAFNIAADDAVALSEAYRRLGVRCVPVPFPVLHRLADVAWRRRWTFITEAPANFVYFITYPWLVSNRRIKEELGFVFQHTTAQTIDAFLAARGRRR